MHCLKRVKKGDWLSSLQVCSLEPTATRSVFNHSFNFKNYSLFSDYHLDIFSFKLLKKGETNLLML